MLSTKDEDFQDWVKEEENPDSEYSYELTTKKQASATGTVFITDTINDRDPAQVPKLNDIFTQSPHTNSLNNLFVKPRDDEAFGEEPHVVKMKDLFGGVRHDTITKSRLSGIIASLDSNNQSSSDQLFSWPVGTKSSSTPTSTFGPLRKSGEEVEDEYPHDIDFLEDSNEPVLVDEKDMDSQKRNEDNENGPKLQQFRMPKSTPLKASSNTFPVHQGGKDASDSILQMSVSNMHNPSLFAEDIRYSSIRNETSMLDLQPVSAPAAEEVNNKRENNMSLNLNARESEKNPEYATSSLIMKYCCRQIVVGPSTLGYLPSNVNLTRISKDLARLDISNSNLTDLLGANSLESFTVKRPLLKLQHLDLSDNIFTQFDGAFFPNLNSLILDRNMAQSISILPSLQTLSAASQRSNSTLTISNFTGPELYLSGNIGITIHEGLVKNVEVLDLSHCSISSIPAAVKSALKLKALYLDHNNIEDLSGTLGYLQQLQVLHLAHNNLCDFYKITKTLGHLETLSTLDIRYNRFISSEIQSTSQLEVARLVLHSCFLTACRSLKVFNQEPVTSSSRRKASKRMAALKSNAASRMKSSRNSVFDNWVPQLQPLQADMTIDEELVLEVLM